MQACCQQPAVQISVQQLLRQGGYSQTHSCWGMPSVMHTTRSSSASMQSMMAYRQQVFCVAVTRFWLWHAACSHAGRSRSADSSCYALYLLGRMLRAAQGAVLGSHAWEVRRWRLQLWLLAWAVQHRVPLTAAAWLAYLGD